MAYLEKIAEAPGSPVLTADDIEAAYKILCDPKSRERLDRRPDDYAWKPTTSQAQAPGYPGHRAWPARASMGKKTVLVGLLILLILFAYFFLVRETGAVCPQCHHTTLFQHAELGGQVTFSCTRAACDYSYVYDRSADPDGPAKIIE